MDGIELAAKRISSSVSEVDLAVPTIHCAGCINAIEKTLMSTPGVLFARVNLTTRRVRIQWDSTAQQPDLFDAIKQAGFKAHVTENTRSDAGNDELQTHIRALAVAGFAAGNVMMLSLSVWSGADENTRHLLHLLSAAIAVPALLFSSRIFFASAWRALRVGRTNMDVPICVGIVITVLLSLFDTSTGGEQVYFDAAIMLVFLLLIGRTLETRMRAKAKRTVDDLARLQPTMAQIESADGQSSVATPVQQVLRDDLIIIDADQRVPVDCTIVSGTSTIDMSLVNGESAPTRVSEGNVLYSGCLNLNGRLRARVVNDVDESFLAQIQRQIDEAETQKGRYQQMADQIVRYYTPFVHIAALLGFLSWMAYSGDWHRAITVGVAVLIITCPCALGLAVPIARVIAAHQLIKQGVLMKEGSALERLALVETVIFDKTGTLTTGQPRLQLAASQFDRQSLSIAQELCQCAEHPYAKAVARYQPRLASATHHTTWQEWAEVPGEGIAARRGSDIYRFGRAAWALNESTEPADTIDGENSLSVLCKNTQQLATFAFDDTVRSDARQTIDRLRDQGLSVELLSGDVIGPASSVAAALNITKFQANAKPSDKLNWVQTHDAQVLMIGDGINDTPSLAAASVSMAPGTGADMTRKMADFVLLNNRLMAIPDAIAIARQARRIVAQNLALAVGYNVVALPLALTGLVTPLLAAIAMSVSSVLVIGNSLRLTAKNSERANLSLRHSATSASISP